MTTTNFDKDFHQELDRYLSLERIEDNIYEIEHFLQRMDQRNIPENLKIKLDILDSLISIFGRREVSTQLHPWDLLSKMKMEGLGNTKICKRLQTQAELLTDAQKRLKKLEVTLKNAKTSYDNSQTMFEEDEFNGSYVPMFKRMDTTKMSIDEFISQLNFFNELPKNNLFSKVW